MYKSFSIFIFLVIFVFFFNIFKYYSSETNLKTKSYNRLNIEQILKDKISNLPILTNDTNNVIEFNDSFEKQIKGKKKRSFWELINRK